MIDAIFGIALFLLIAATILFVFVIGIALSSDHTIFTNAIWRDPDD